MFQENKRLQNDVHQGSQSDRKFKSLDLIRQKGQPEYYLTEEEKSHYHQALSPHKAKTPEQEFAVYVFDEARNIIKDGHDDISEKLQERRIYYFLKKREREAYDLICNKNMQHLTDTEEKVLQFCRSIGTILKESSSYHQISEKVANERSDIINKSRYRDQKAREEIYRQNTVASRAGHLPDILSSGGERLSGSLTPEGSHSFLDHRQSSVSHQAKEFINRGDGIEDLPERLQQQQIRFSASQIQSSERPSSTVSRETELSGAPNSEALKELMKGPDTFTAYGPQTQTLLQDFGKKFPVTEQIIRRNPPAMQLVNEAAKAGVTFSGYAENGPLQMNHSHAEEKCVFIRKWNDPIETMGSFLMELTNGINHLRFQKVYKQAYKGRITKEDYVYKNLEIEAEGALKVGEIWYQIKMASKNPTKLDAYDHDFYLRLYLAGHQKGKARMIDTMRTVKGLEGRMTHQEHYEQSYEKLRKWYFSHGSSLTEDEFRRWYGE